MSRQKTLADREQYVAKANELIRNTRYSLTAQQQKIILFAISKIKPDDDISTEYTININELANACGINLRGGGYYYTDLKKDIDYLTQRDWCHMPDGLHMTMSWIGDAKIYDNDAVIKIRFNPNMQPYLFDLKRQYTLYQLQKVLVFRGKYTIRLYEIIRSFISKKDLDNGTFEDDEKTLSIEELRNLFDLGEKYKRWVDIKRYVLDPAIDEINKYCDEFCIKECKGQSGSHTKKITSVYFYFTRAHCGQQLTARQKEKQLNGLPY